MAQAKSKEKAKRTKIKHFKSFVFNRYVDPDRKKIIKDASKIAEIQYKGMKFYRTYYNNTENENRKKKLKGLEEEILNPGSRKLGAGEKAGITRKRNKIAKKKYRCIYEKLNKTQKKKVDKILNL